MAYIEKAKLPATLARALESLGYGRKDIEVKTAESTTLENPAYGDGYRASVTVLNLNTGESRSINGSWGGANPWQTKQGAQVDGMGDDRDFPLEPGVGAVIKSQRGGGRPVSATVYVHPDTVRDLLADPDAEPIPADVVKILSIAIGLKSFARSEYTSREGLGDWNSDNPLVSKAIELGLLKQNKAGALSFTTAGKNAARA